MNVSYKLAVVVVWVCFMGSAFPSRAIACSGPGYVEVHVSDSFSEVHGFELPVPDTPVASGFHGYGDAIIETLFKDVQSTADGDAAIGFNVENDPYEPNADWAAESEPVRIGYIVEPDGGWVPVGVEFPKEPVRSASDSGSIRLGLIRETPFMFFTPSYFSVRVTPINQAGVRGPGTKVHIWRAGKPWSVLIAAFFGFAFVKLRRRRASVLISER